MQRAGLGLPVGDGEGPVGGGLAAMLALESGAGVESEGYSAPESRSDSTPESKCSEGIGDDLERSRTLARLFGSGLIGRSADTSSVVYVSTEQRVPTEPMAHQVRHCLRRRDLQPQPRASDEKGEALLPVTGSTEGSLLAWLPHVCSRTGFPLEPHAIEMGDDGRFALVKFRYVVSATVDKDKIDDVECMGPCLPAPAIGDMIAAARHGGGARATEALYHRGSARTSGAAMSGVSVRGHPGADFGKDGSESWDGLARSYCGPALPASVEGRGGVPGSAGAAASVDQPYVVVGPLWKDLPIPVGMDIDKDVQSKL